MGGGKWRILIHCLVLRAAQAICSDEETLFVIVSVTVTCFETDIAKRNDWAKISERNTNRKIIKIQI